MYIELVTDTFSYLRSHQTKNSTMKKTLLTLSVSALTLVALAQTQVSNSNFEAWSTVSSGEEPDNWNSFLSAGGSLSWAASDQCGSSTDVRPGSTGSKSAKIFSVSTFSIIANGNLTLGQINMGNASPSSTSNYNSSIIADANFSEAITDSPDSLVFWAKFIPANAGGSDSARVSAILHDNYELRDPIDAGSMSHVVATAIRNFKTANGWMRMAVPFTYSGPSTNPQFLLLTFTTNKNPGGGSDNDQLFIDDMELIYNPSTAGMEENTNELPIVAMNGELSIVHANGITGCFAVHSIDGSLLFTGDLSEKARVSSSQLVVVTVTTAAGTFAKKVYVNH